MDELLILVISPGIGHVPRPRKFTIANIICIGIFPCKLPPAVFTRLASWQSKFNSPGEIINKNTPPKGEAFLLVISPGIEPGLPG